MSKPTNVVGRRVAAFLIDGLLLYALTFGLFFAMADTKNEIAVRALRGELSLDETTYGNITIGDEEYALVGGDFILWLFLTFLIGFLYLAVLQGIKGWTLGKLALNIRVVDESGRTGPGVGKAAIRWLLWIVDGFFFYLVALVTALASDKNQRVGDMVAKTYVVGQGDVGRAPFGGQPQFAGAGGYGQPQQFGQQQGFGQQPQAAQQGQGAGWHPDPHGQARLRYWDGSQWTEHTSQ
jgi:uncharacterized RDD family membrane protein YckC